MIYSNTKSKVKPKTMPKAEREAYAKWCAKYDIKPEGKVKKKPTPTIPLPELLLYDNERFGCIPFVPGGMTIETEWL